MCVAQEDGGNKGGKEEEEEEEDAGEKSSAAWERRELLLGVNCAREMIVMVVNAGLTQSEDSYEATSNVAVKRRTLEPIKSASCSFSLILPKRT